VARVAIPFSANMARGTALLGPATRSILEYRFDADCIKKMTLMRADMDP